MVEKLGGVVVLVYKAEDLDLGPADTMGNM